MHLTTTFNHPTFVEQCNKFKSGGLHEKHVVATWNLGNHLSIYLQT